MGLLNIYNDFKDTLNIVKALVDALNCLKKMEQTAEVINEQKLIKEYLNSILSKNNQKESSFSRRLQKDNTDLLVTFNEIIKDIDDFYNIYDDKICPKEPLSNIYISINDMLSLVERFYYSIDSEWGHLAHRLLHSDKSIILKSIQPSYSAYFKISKLWICNINNSHTVQDLIDCLHETTHGINDQICKKEEHYSFDNILLEFFPELMSLIFVEWLIECNIYPEEALKYRNNYLASIYECAEQVMCKYKIASQFTDINDLSVLLKEIQRVWNINITEDELESLYDDPVSRNIFYVYPYTIAIEFLNLYHCDLEKFWKNVKLFLRNSDDDLSTIKKLGIKPNQHPLA